MAIEAFPAAGPATDVLSTLPQSPPQGQWTYDAFLALPDDGNRYEVLQAVLYVAPPPSPQHQDRLFNLCYKVRMHIDGQKLGRLFVSPVALLMPGAAPVQPDAFFLAADNPAQIDWRRHVEGVPDLVIEVTSPSTAGYDRREKQDAYARAGVREYWIVDPWGRTIELLQLDPATRVYRSLGIFSGESLLPTQVLPGLPSSVTALLG